MCGSINGTVECTCASSVEGNGICFDKGRFRCEDSALPQCRASRDCPIGSACVLDYCNCGTAPTRGICVGTEGCGDAGVEVMGALVRIGETEKRRRVNRGLVSGLL